MSPRRLSIDFETASTCDLRRTGAHAYAEHPDTRVLCMAWAFDDDPVQVWTPDRPFPHEIVAHVAQGGEIHAFNVHFEWCIWNECLTRMVADLPELRLDQCWCTMARAAHWGLPLSLADAGDAIGLNLPKDRSARDLMLRMARPRRWEAPNPPVWWHETDAPKYQALQAYCARDVQAERELGSRLPPLPDYERRVWLMDARMNARGFEIDVSIVHRLHAILTREVTLLDREMKEVTGGRVAATTNVAALARYVGVPSLDAGALDDCLADPFVMGPRRRALELRKLARRSSTRKLAAMLECLSRDGRIRGLFQYAGAGRTLRWAGRLVQPQNLPRPVKGIDPNAVLDAVGTGAGADLIRLFWGEPLDVVAASLRGCFRARPGYTFAVCDFSAIEARVIAWLAGQAGILEVFARGEDVYKYTAALIGSDDRQLGKVLVLACGFGMGPGKFQATARTYGIDLDAARAEELVGLWRASNPAIVSFWYDLEQACKDALANPAQSFRVGPLKVRMGRNLMAGALLIVLPSGHYLCYREASLEWRDGRQGIVYSGTDQATRRWQRVRTYGGKLAENVTQSVARHLLADAMLRCEAQGFPLVASIHDEIACEVPAPEGERVFRAMRTIMRTPPSWASSLPLDGAGSVGVRYGKA